MKPLHLILLPLFIAAASIACADEQLLFDFETKDYAGWTIEGEAFGPAPVRGARLDIQGFRGQRLANSFHPGDEATGALTSPPFKIERDYLVLLVGGGNHPQQTGVELLADGQSVRSATGADSPVMHWRSWDVRPLRGRQVQLRIFDRIGGGWGHVNVDQVHLADEPRTGWGTWRLEEYRQDARYYREAYRPQFHFSPELNWMNDPNGLVYYQGEYHLFYQHNPHGNAWGHMSWGHAVSRDLLRWRHLPVALFEEYGVMIFSGSAVVDWHNTSGFGRGDEPPLVAIYTGHGHGRQTQDLAYSNNRGRTWTKYAGNPVLDINQADFRDPKVYWHAPTQRWIMVVSLAAERVIRFYASPDLKQWTHLSDFGPAGAKDKPNWECPDLLELPIEGEPGKTRWLLEADMGGGAIAGGSGGEYFVGWFDGKRFVPDHPHDQPRWVDYGRDFYAPVSWSDIPASDGRRIWIGWMNNWETSLLPTYPWRSAMSIPRQLSLRRTPTGLRLIQQPVDELRHLRDGHSRVEDLKVDNAAINLSDHGISGAQLEIIAEFEIGAAAEFGLRVRKGENEQTIVGYDTARQQVFVDRRESGEVDFHDRFAGRHAGPLPRENGRIQFHIFIDTSSIEVFAGRGHTVITDRIFPDAASTGVELYAAGGAARLISLDAWELQSVWRR